jgi:hypothetical protein
MEDHPHHGHAGNQHYGHMSKPAAAAVPVGTIYTCPMLPRSGRGVQRSTYSCQYGRILPKTRVDKEPRLEILEQLASV